MRRPLAVRDQPALPRSGGDRIRADGTASESGVEPVFAAEWWLRGHASLPDWTGKPGSSDGVDATGAWQSSTGEASSSRSPTAVSTP